MRIVKTVAKEFGFNTDRFYQSYENMRVYIYYRQCVLFNSFWTPDGKNGKGIKVRPARTSSDVLRNGSKQNGRRIHIYQQGQRNRMFVALR